MDVESFGWCVHINNTNQLKPALRSVLLVPVFIPQVPAPLTPDRNVLEVHLQRLIRSHTQSGTESAASHQHSCLQSFKSK